MPWFIFPTDSHYKHKCSQFELPEHYFTSLDALDVVGVPRFGQALILDIYRI